MVAVVVVVSGATGTAAAGMVVGSLRVVPVVGMVAVVVMVTV